LGTSRRAVVDALLQKRGLSRRVTRVVTSFSLALPLVSNSDRVGVCNATVYRLVERVELPHVRTSNSIRIRPDDLRTFLDRQAAPGAKA
jgi:excisionase family DNA binding protein